MRLIRAADCRTMPWKNGQGSTIEIAVSPADAGLDDFDWRVSMATVRADGPFSIFADIDRTLSVLQGAGLRLAVADRSPQVLTSASAPYAFRADVAASASLVDGPITDLNVMSRRGRLRHAVTRLQASSSLSLESATDDALLFCASGAADVTAADGSASLDAGDCLVVARSGASLIVSPKAPSEIFWIEFFFVEG